MQRQTNTRDALLGLLQDTPGLSPGEAARTLGIDRTTAHYHLRRLVRDGHAVLGGTTRCLRYFPAGAVPPAARSAFIAAHEAAALLDALRVSPGTTQTDLARALNVPRPTVAWRLGRLRRIGLVRAERDGRTVRLHADLTLLEGWTPPPDAAS